MPARGEPKLTEEAQVFVVQAVACFDAPSVVAAAVKKEFGLVVTPQAIEVYDPNKRAGRNISDKWRELFEATRKAFLEDTAQIGISHRAVRLRSIQRMADKAEGMGNLALAAQLNEQAAKEAGNAYTNKRELSGPNGSPLTPTVIVNTMTPQQAADAYADSLRGEG